MTYFVISSTPQEALLIKPQKDHSLLKLKLLKKHKPMPPRLFKTLLIALLKI
jgi:hypothetical protein